jgi:death-on-curing protein
MSVPLNLDAFVESLNEVGFVVRDAGLLASALERPHTTLFGKEVYPTLSHQAAALGQAIAKYHPMLDGNKRSAWIAMNVFLELNGYDLGAATDDAFDLMLDIANDRIELDEIAGWIDQRIRPL